MAACMLVTIKASIKRYHVYKQNYPVGTHLKCFLDPENEHSDSAIVVKKGDDVVGHVPEGLCQPLTRLFKGGHITEILAEVKGEACPSAKGVFVQGGGIEIPCSYKVFGSRDNKTLVKSIIKKEIRKLTV